MSDEATPRVKEFVASVDELVAWARTGDANHAEYWAVRDAYTALERSLTAALSALRAAEGERERYRNALERINEYDRLAVGPALDIARAALAGGDKG